MDCSAWRRCNAGACTMAEPSPNSLARLVNPMSTMAAATKPKSSGVSRVAMMIVELQVISWPPHFIVVNEARPAPWPDREKRRPGRAPSRCHQRPVGDSGSRSRSHGLKLAICLDGRIQPRPTLWEPPRSQAPASGLLARCPEAPPGPRPLPASGCGDARERPPGTAPRTFQRLHPTIYSRHGPFPTDLPPVECWAEGEKPLPCPCPETAGPVW